jgi:hypothetical protein
MTGNVMNGNIITNPWVFRVTKIVDGKEVNAVVSKHRSQAGALIDMQCFLTGWMAIKYETGDYKCYVSRFDGSSLSAYGTKTIRAYSHGHEANIKTTSQIIIDHRIK